MDDDLMFEDMHMDEMEESPFGDTTEEELYEYLLNNPEQITPEILEILEDYKMRAEKKQMVYNRIEISELLENCMVPTLAQATQMLTFLLVMCLVFRILCLQRRFGSKEIGAPHWLIHLGSAVFGIMVLNSFFKTTLLYLVACCALSYFIFTAVCMWRRDFCGLAGAILVVIFSVSCELFLVEAATWHRIRGAQIILSMKIISLGVDVGKGAIVDLPNIFEYMGYCFNVGTVVFGPWVSYAQYYKVVDSESSPLSFSWLGKIFTTLALAVFCLTYSNCFTHWLILDHAVRWILAYRDAQSFRFSHYFISFLSDTTSSLSGLSPEDGSVSKWNVVRPQHIEIPRSLVEVVTNWNLPMHYWLRTYVFKTVRPYGTFLAVILTYAASSLLHGLNFQLAAVLFSLGFYSYTEFVFRKRLSQVFDACIQAKRCKEKCDHKYTSRNPLVFLTNLAFGALTVFHLAYLGLMFDSSDGEEKGYHMWHTLDKWSGLGFLSHWIALGTFGLYWLI